jgi:hypothetical protein
MNSYVLIRDVAINSHLVHNRLEIDEIHRRSSKNCLFGAERVIHLWKAIQHVICERFPLNKQGFVARNVSLVLSIIWSSKLSALAVVLNLPAQWDFQRTHADVRSHFQLVMTNIFKFCVEAQRDKKVFRNLI